MGPNMCSAHRFHGMSLLAPGLGYLYSGLTRRKNALSLLFLAIVSLAIVSFQWFFIGYSLVFSSTGGVFLGDGAHVGFRGVLDQPIGEANNRIPAIVFATYQMVSHQAHTKIMH
jgi:Amt family ammonium transporter